MSINPEEHRTWIVTLSPLSEDLILEESEMIENGEAEAKQFMSDQENELNFIRFIGKSKFRREAQPNDQIIIIWKETNSAPPQMVYRQTSIIYRKDESNCTMFFYEETTEHEETAIEWDDFIRLVEKVNLKPRLGNNSCRLISNEDSEALFWLWPR